MWNYKAMTGKWGCNVLAYRIITIFCYALQRTLFNKTCESYGKKKFQDTTYILCVDFILGGAYIWLVNLYWYSFLFWGVTITHIETKTIVRYLPRDKRFPYNERALKENEREIEGELRNFVFHIFTFVSILFSFGPSQIVGCLWFFGETHTVWWHLVKKTHRHTHTQTYNWDNHIGCCKYMLNCVACFTFFHMERIVIRKTVKIPWRANWKTEARQRYQFLEWILMQNGGVFVWEKGEG